MIREAVYPLQLINVSKTIGQNKIIDDISLHVPKGEVFGLLGPNGAGKTTLIRMIVGLMSITRGEILIHGHSITREFEQAVQYVGAIVENPELYKFMTGYQNLLHYARMLPSVSKQRMEEVISLVRLENRIHDPVKTYSLGMRQRLGVAQAILHRPSLLILDEPTNGLDPAGIRELRDYIHHLAKTQGTTVIVSSHLLSEMELMCDRVAIIQKGHLLDVKLVKDYTKRSEGVRVIFEVDEPAKAQKVVESMGLTEKNNPSSITREGLEVRLNREQIPFVNEGLVQAQIKVYSIRALATTLEENFLELTQDGDPIV